VTFAGQQEAVARASQRERHSYRFPAIRSRKERRSVDRSRCPGASSNLGNDPFRVLIAGIFTGDYADIRQPGSHGALQ